MAPVLWEVASFGAAAVERSQKCFTLHSFIPLFRVAGRPPISENGQWDTVSQETEMLVSPPGLTPEDGLDLQVGIHHTHFLTFGELSCIGWYKITSLLMPPECCSANSALQAQDYDFILVTVMRFFPETPEKRNIFQSVRKGLRPTMLTLVHAFSDGVKPMH